MIPEGEQELRRTDEGRADMGDIFNQLFGIFPKLFFVALGLFTVMTSVRGIFP